MYSYLLRLQLITTILLLSIPLAGLHLTASAQTPETTNSVPTQDQKAEADQLFQQGVEQFRSGSFPAALETYQNVLKIRLTLNDQAGIAETLDNIGETYTQLSNYNQAWDALEQALTIRQELDDQAGIGETLNNMGYVHRLLSDYPQALTLHQQALAIAQTISNRAIEAEALHNIAAIDAAQGEYDSALELYQQALAIRQEVGDKRDEGRTVNNIAGVYYNLGDYQQALNYYQQALAMRQTLNDKAGIGRILSNMGLVYRQFGQDQQALASYQQALAILKDINDRASIGSTLNNLGTVHENLGQYEDALTAYQEALTIAQDINNQAGEANALENIGGIYYSRGQYPQALNFYQQALTIRQGINDKAGVGNTLNNIGGVYYDLGQYSQALNILQQALTIRQETGDKAGEGNSLRSLGIVYERLNQYPQALATYEQALTIARTIQDKASEAKALDHIGGVYSRMGLQSQAFDFYQQALEISRDIGDKAGEGRILNSLASAYATTGKNAQALALLQPALDIFREIGDRPGQRIALSNIATLFEQQNQPELAVLFYKEAVNVTETIRQNLQTLTLDDQKTYTETVADPYRALANLLLSQGRILEAQQVLELLKVQELRQFTKNTRAGGETSGIATTPTETELLQIHRTLIALGRKIEDCQQRQCEEKSQLINQRQAITQQFEATIQSLETEIRDRLDKDIAFLDPELLGDNAEKILSSQPGTVIIYPLVLEDKLWILWAAAGGILQSIEVPQVGVAQLSDTVFQFRLLLQDTGANRAELKATAEKLYNWLIPESLQQELQDNQIDNLVFALDHVTRYIPMSALFDGETYLIERYTISTIISANVTNLRDRLPPGTDNTFVLGLGLSQPVLGFRSLPNVPEELDAIVRQSATDPKGIYPGLEFLNDAFNYKALKDNLANHLILHIATHSNFVPGNAYNSYLVLGDGDKLSIPDIQNLQNLGNIHLVVLSACETALGGSGTDGTEIAGLSYYFINGGAQAVMASLWPVDDQSTRLLMEQFYNNLAKGTPESPITKAQALRQAQLSLLRGDVPMGSSQNTASTFSDPYYWAPFILIGNNL
ncbi:MAG: tetratricopeptide repeat protein [Coleofasciculus sp. B1-GNL1-01]